MPITIRTLTIAMCWSALALLVAIPRTTSAFAPTAGYTRIAAVTTTTTTNREPIKLGAAPFRSAGGFFLGDGDLGIDVGADPSAFTDQIDYLGDPTVRTLVLVFGGVIVLLAGLGALSSKVDAAIENVLVDFETVMTSNREFEDRWEAIESQLRVYDGEVEKARMRKQKLFEIMEELEQTEPELMKRVSAKMAALNSGNQ